jgi:hypothetical protein
LQHSTHFRYTAKQRHHLFPSQVLKIKTSPQQQCCRDGCARGSTLLEFNPI